MSTVKVEVGQYRVMDKGALKAFFTLTVYPYGLQIYDCRHFVMGERSWFNLPEKEIKKPDGQKSQWVPIVRYLDKDYLKELQDAVLEALKHAKPMEKNAQNNSTNQRKENSLQTDASDTWEESPF